MGVPGRRVEPIAIVGIGCRLPGGASDPESFWSLLTERRSGIRDVPPDRWNVERYHHPDIAAPGAMVMRRGGFIEHLDGFDASFWNISPREARRMDPQQRWLLEVAWEAMEDAGIAPERLRGRNVGVYVGISGNDYGGLQLRSPDDVDAYTNSGATASIASNRISYLLDLRGPSVSLDTACSSSLVAVSAACENIRAGTCDAALAGGVNALISPPTSIGFSKASMISPTGHCYAFDARANGFVRAEGAGMVYLKPLSSALAAGDRIYAVIRAVAVNQDGHTSSMTVPGVDGQSAMLEAAYRQAGISPGQVAYVEAHGTGTPVGDPIEAAALGRVLRRGRPAGSTCLIGSVKTNIGHLESGAGIAGLIKAALVLHHRTIPATLNHERPNPHIPFAELQLEVTTTARPLPSTGTDLPIVAVNSFGFGGTNAHAVLEAAPPSASDGVPIAPRAAQRPHLLPISARDERALRAYVEAYRERLADGSTPLADLCAAAGAHKDHHPHRLVLVGRTRDELRDRAAAWLRDGGAEGATAGRPLASAAPVFVFAGQGPQWWAMGRQLMEREPVFRRWMHEIDAAIEHEAGWSLLSEMRRPQDESRIDHTDVAQPAIFAVQVALVELWKSWGVHAARAVGHSVGEVAAAWCAGVYSLADAVRIITTRARLQHRTFGGGRMLAVALPADEARAAITSATGVELAAINSPGLMTLAGEIDSLADIEQRLTARGVFVRWLRGRYAFHSAQMDPIQDEVLAALSGISPRPTAIPLYSTVTGARIDGERLDAHYWWRNIRQAVLFGAAIDTSIAEGDRCFLELSPHPVLESSIKECLGARGETGAVCHSLRRDADDSEELAANVAALHVAGVDVDWMAVNQGARAFPPLPCYPWSRESFWIESEESARSRLAPPAHPLLGQRIETAVPTWQQRLDLHRLRYLADHRVWDTVVFPAAAYSEMGLALARILFPEEPHAVEQLEIVKALFLSDQAPVTLQTTYTADDRTFAIYAVSGGTAAGPWDLHARGVLTRLAASRAEPVVLESLRSSLPEHLDHDGYCRELAARGFQFGPSFRQVRNIWRRGSEVLIEIRPPQVVSDDRGYVFHPAVQDACFHVFIGLPRSGGAAEPPVFLPHSIRRVQVYGNAAPQRLWAHAAASSMNDSAIEADIAVYDDEGTRVADVLGFRMEAVERKRQQSEFEDCCYQVRWEPRRLRGSGVRGSCQFPAAQRIGGAIREALPALEERHGLVEYHRRFVPAMEHVASLLTVRAFAALGWKPAPGDRVELNDLMASLHIEAGYRRVTRRLLGSLEGRGVLRPVGEKAWEVAATPDVGDAEAALAELAERFPAAEAEIELFRRTGLALGSILDGRTDPLELLFPGGSPAAMERFYAEALGFPAHLEAVRIAVQHAVAALPDGRALRVLEVGGGTGVLTQAVLPALPPHRTDYLFTDVGAGFTAAARTRFAAHPFIDYQVFDIEADPESQGLPAGQFDLILGGDVVHATADVRAALRHLHRCLAPGGLLVLLELARPAFVRDDLTFGLLRGYSRFTDSDLRPHSALLNPSQWRQVLPECGFADVEVIDCFSDPAVSEHAIVLGFAPAAAAMSIPVTADQGRRFVLVADTSGVADALADALRRAGHSASLVPPDTPLLDSVGVGAATPARNFRRAVPATAGGDAAGVIHCGAVDAPAADGMTLDDLDTAQASGLISAFHLIRDVAETGTPVWFVTRGAQRVVPGDRLDGLASAPLNGLLRVANTEHQCRFSTIDLDDGALDMVAPLLADEILLGPDGDFEIAFRNGVRYAPRLLRAPIEQLARRTIDAHRAEASVPFQLETHGPGVLTNLALHETTRQPPAPGEVEVCVRAAGLNFRDVMKALGTYPGRPEDVLWFGDDLAGTVLRVGDGVDAFRPGDEVAGMAPYAFRACARTDARMLFRKPAQLSFAEAATIPTVFLTAHYAINHLARMQPGESILIHAATGGVGLAAIQVARHRSLRIFATAGTPEKRRLLAGMGVEHVMSSRTLAFADEIMRITGGRGVDAVLNSLAGDFIPKSLSVLAPFGRFVEIGKVDIYRNANIGLHALRNNISYFVIDLTQHLRQKPAFVVQMFAEIAERFAAGDYRPIAHTSFPVAEAVEAFRYMAQGRHVGKNVLTFDGDEIPVAFTTDPRHRFKADATYLITGGAGGFGLEVADWIVRNGGRHVVLMSRSGPRDEEGRARIEAMRSAGASMVDARGDVTRLADVAQVLNDIARDLPPLRGVFHAAMVLDDDLIALLDDERVRAALRPKMAGAWNLHTQTAGLPLDHFVCFSSFSCSIGMLRQANYNAGNAFLDALAHYRRARSLPALTVNWGAIRGAGFVDRDQKTADALVKLGFGSFQKDEALRLLDALLVRDAPNVVAARADWTAARKLSPLVATSRAYGALTRDTGAAREGGSLASRLRAASPSEQEQLLHQFITEQVAAVFGTAGDKIDRSARLSDLGFDSLMTLELTNRFERELGVRVPMGTLVGASTLLDLARQIQQLLAPHLAMPDSQPARSLDEPAGHLVVLKPGDGVPVFCFHPVGGGVTAYAGLAPHLPTEVPLYGIESRVATGEDEYRTIDEMVEAYVSVVRAAHPGPYRLLGFSMGGYLAARVAGALEQDGHAVELVGVLDWDAAQRTTPAAQREALVGLSVASYLFFEQEMGMLTPRPERLLREELGAIVDRLTIVESGGGDDFFRWVVDNGLTTSPAMTDLARQYLDRFERHVRLLSQALPAPRFNAPLIIWRAAAGFGSSLESWRPAGGLGCEHVCEGDHNSMMRPAALKRIAAQLIAFMDLIAAQDWAASDSARATA